MISIFLNIPMVSMTSFSSLPMGNTELKPGGIKCFSLRWKAEGRKRSGGSYPASQIHSPDHFDLAENLARCGENKD